MTVSESVRKLERDLKRSRFYHEEYRKMYEGQHKETLRLYEEQTHWACMVDAIREMMSVETSEEGLAVLEPIFLRIVKDYGAHE